MLFRKLIRDLWESRWQYSAVALVVVIGVAFYGAAYMSYRSMRASYELTYSRLKFEDFGVAFSLAPDRVVNRIREIPGVEAVEGRLVQDVALELFRDPSRQMVGRLISVPIGRRPEVNDLLLAEGRYLGDRTAREVLLEFAFATKNGLHPGDSLEVLHRGARTKLTIAGIVKSPEFIYVVRSKQDIMPSAESFGVLFISQEVLRQILGQGEAISEVRVRVASPDRRPAAMRETKRLLSAYRPEDVVAREDQPSYQLLEQDLDGFQMYSVLFPVLFLGVASLTIYSLLSRMVHSQRSVIGMLRALGFSSGAVVRHYLAAALVIGLVSGVLGTLIGLWLSRSLTDWYLSFLTSPFRADVAQWDVILIGIGIGSGVCFAAGYAPSRWTSSVQPATSMRPEPPPIGRVMRLDAIIPRIGLLSRIPIRGLFRQPRRSVTSLLGVVASVAMVVTAQGLQDSTDALVIDLAATMFREDLRLDFIEYEDRSVVGKIRSWQGVAWAEGELGLPMTFRKGQESYEALAVGLEEGSRLTKLTDEANRAVRPAVDGAVFGRTLRNRLKLEVGDWVEFGLMRSMVEEKEPRRTSVRVAAFSDEPVGTIAYFRQSDLRAAVQDDIDIPLNAVNSVRVLAEPTRLDELKRRMLELELAGTVNSTAKLRSEFEGLLDMMRQFILAMLGFGAALAFVVMFNMVTMNVIERESEVATMRTLGIGRWQIAWMVTQENLWLCLIGLIAGLPVGRWMCEAFLTAAQNEEQQELFTFGVTIAPSTYWLASGLVVLATLVAQIPSLGRLNRLNLAAIIKRAAH